MPAHLEIASRVAPQAQIPSILPLEYDQQQHGYRYTEDVSTFPVFEVGAAELAGLFLARHALESVRGTNLEQTMR